MDAIQENRLPNLLQTFPTHKEQPPDNKAYIKQLNHYLSILLSKSPGIAATILYKVLNNLFRNVWEEIYSAKESEGELRKVNLLWWEAKGCHRVVDAEYYLKNWKANYAELAENWEQIEGNPENIARISLRIKRGIAGLLCVNEYEDAIFATLKYHQATYPRLNKWSLWGKPIAKDHDRCGEWDEDITRCISTYPYSGGFNFLGELSGAYILSCPVNYISRDWSVQEPFQNNKAFSSEEHVTMVLLKYIHVYGSQEFAMDAADLPLRCIKKPGEEWKYVIEIPS